MTVNFQGNKITANKQAINGIIILLNESADYMKENGWDALADSYRRNAHELYEKLDSLGYYDKFKEETKNELLKDV